MVPAEAAGDRLDLFLVRQMPDWSRSQIKRLIREGLVTVGSASAKKSGEVIEAGTPISVKAEHEESKATPEDLPLAVIFEDSDILVVNKAAGMVVHVGSGIKSGTLVNALLRYLAPTSGLSTMGGGERPGIVHRLDKMTSGLVVVAKNDAAHRRLSEQFKSREVRKTYLALVHGRVAADCGEISRPVGRDPRRRTRMKAGGIAPREALTKYRVLRRFEPLHPSRSEAPNWSHAPNPRASGQHWASRGWRYNLRRARPSCDSRRASSPLCRAHFCMPLSWLSRIPARAHRWNSRRFCRANLQRSLLTWKAARANMERLVDSRWRFSIALS